MINRTPFFSFVRPLAVVAFGGNALLPPEDSGTTEEQLVRAREAVRKLLPILGKGYELVVVHGNGPQVGNVLIQAEAAADRVPRQPLDFCVAQTEGSIGFLLELAFGNELSKAGFRKEIVTIVTQVQVDAADPAFDKPTKPVGPFFPKDKAARLMDEMGWSMVEDSGRGWRKVVASPRPVAIRGVDVMAALVNRGHIVIAAGGGGVPVVVTEEGEIRGVEAVIDKDYAASMLAASLQADLFIVLTGVERVARDFGKPTQRELPEISAREAKALLAEGQFPAGSMGPKVDAAIRYIEAGGREVLITRAESLAEALEGRTGTRIREATA
ncbi:MAG TPA: carbamate kinase [Thermoanaerobaculia bacterium]|nr:carbamate kinase [Thermoanaerobaculia bacterium]